MTVLTSPPDGGRISLATRSDIVEALRTHGYAWSGDLDEVTFLSRLYDLSNLPSLDRRFKNAIGDIQQHRIANADWDADWVFADRRFNLLRGEGPAFLTFLCEMLHPDVRPNQRETDRLLTLLNKRLALDGWELSPVSASSGEVTYGVLRRPQARLVGIDTPKNFPLDGEGFVGSLVELLKQRGAVRETAILVNSDVSFPAPEYDNWNGGTHHWRMVLALDVRVYSGLSTDDREAAGRTIDDLARDFFAGFDRDVLRSVVIVPRAAPAEGWRTDAVAWLTGAGITNQGRVRSDNIASRECDGLLFRSQPEIHLYRALKRLGLTFAPLPVFLRGGEMYTRIEPDFVLLKDGVVMVVEVDGDTFHAELPADAHKRLQPLDHEGARIERVRADECGTPELASACAQRLLRILERRIAQRA